MSEIVTGVASIPSGNQFPVAPETSAVFTITNAENYSAVINDQTSAYYVGSIAGADGLSGFESPEVRENAQDLVEADGGVQGNNWYGRRPVTLTVEILGTSIADRNNKVQRLRRATNAMRQDGVLTWPVSGGEPVFLTFRRQSALRIAGGWLKVAFIPLVAADPRIYSNQAYQVIVPKNGSNTVENQGDAESPPSVVINGPGTDPSLSNGGAAITFGGLTLAAGESVTLDFLLHTIVKNDGTNQYGTLDFPATTWWNLGPGVNTVSLNWSSGGTGASTAVVNWRDAWL